MALTIARFSSSTALLSNAKLCSGRCCIDTGSHKQRGDMTDHHHRGRRLVRRAREIHDAVHRAAGRRRKRAKAPPHAVSHVRRGIALKFAQLRSAGGGALVAFLAVVGPGLLAGLSDDDPAGITTYSVLGADHGYRLLWIIPASTALLVYFHLVAVRIGAASGKGFVGVIRERWGPKWAYCAVIGLLLANFGTICAEYAGIAAAA